MDRLLRALFSVPALTTNSSEAATVVTEGRFVLADIQFTADEMAGRHKCGQGSAEVMAEAAVGMALLGAMLKGEERLGLQIIGNGPLGRVMVESTGEHTLRGFPRNPEAVTTAPTPQARSASLLGTTGQVHVMRSLDSKVVYQGAAPLLRIGIEPSLEAYLSQSEQIPSLMFIVVEVAPNGHVTMARGLMLQALGGGDREVFEAFLDSVERTKIKDALRSWDGEALSSLTEQLPSMDTFSTMDESPIRFLCTCDRDRAAGMLLALGFEDLKALKEEQGRGEVDCAFCREVFVFEGFEFDTLLKVSEQTAAG